MGLETGDYISDLVETNPPGTDNVSQGDDHIRLIKHVLKDTFPNLTGAVTKTQDELNEDYSQGLPVVTVYTTPGAAQTHTFDPTKTYYKVTLTGGGGGSSTAVNDIAGSAGGTAIKTEAITEATATYTLGAGGTVGASGDDSTFKQGANDTITAQGGSVGLPLTTVFVPATGVNGDMNINGGGGHNSGSNNSPAQGGSSYWGGGVSNDTGGNSELGAYGSGGRAKTEDEPGIGGTNGVIMVEEF